MTLQDRAASLGVARVAGWAIGLLCAVSVLALGGTPLWATVVLGAIAAPGLLLASLATRSGYRSLHPAALVLFALASFSVVQALPVPVDTLAILSPTAADIWSRALLPAGREVAWGSLSLDPGASLVAGARWATLACAFQLAVLAGRIGDARKTFRIVAVCGMAVALISLGHQLVGAERVFGIYQPRSSDFRAHGVGPLLNQNHLAGYLNFAALVGLGQVLQPKSSMPRWLMAAGVIVCVGVSLRTGSLGGAAGLALGIVVLFGLLLVRWYFKRDSKGFSMQSAALVGVAVVGAGTVLAWIGWDHRIIREITTVNTGKARMVGWVSPMLHDFWRTGVGRGAFESTFEAYRPAIGTNVAFTHPENFVVQWISEWGIVGGVALLGLAWLLRPKSMHLRNPANAGATAAAVALLGQNLADFSLELAGPAMAFAVVLGALSGEGTRRRASVRPWYPSWLLSVGTVVLIAVAALRGAPSLFDAREDVRAVMTNDPKAPSVRPLIESMMLRFPADYYFPMIGAEAAERAGTDPTPWVQRALERAPNVGRVHLLLANILVRRGATLQALLELRTAVEMEPALKSVAGKRAVRWTRDVDQLASGVPDIDEGAGVFEAMSLEAARLGDRALSSKLDLRALERFPDHLPTRSRAVDRVLAGITDGSCAPRDACIAELEAHGAYFLKRAPESTQGDVIAARARIARGDVAGARVALREGCKKPKDASTCLVFLAELEEPPGLDAVMDRVISLSCATADSCAAAYDWASGLYASKNMWAQAYGAGEHAARAKPTQVRWVRTAQLAARAGLGSEQAAAERKAAQWGPN